MATVDKYILDVEARTDQAVKRLQEVNKLMNQIEGVKERGTDNYETVSQKGMDKSMRNMAKISSEKKKLEQEMKEMETELQDNLFKTGSGESMFEGMAESTKAEVNAARSQMESLVKDTQRQTNDMKKAHQEAQRSMKELSTFQQTYSKNFTPIHSSKDSRNLPSDRGRAENVVQAQLKEENRDPFESSMRQVQSKTREAKSMLNKGRGDRDRAMSSGYMSHQQSEGFQYAAMDAADYDKKGVISDNQSSMADLGQQRKQLSDEVGNIVTKEDGATKAEIDKKVVMEENIKAIDKEWEAREELHEALSAAVSGMKRFNEEISQGKEGEGTEVKPERGTTRGMIYERAPAVGLALTGAVGYSVASNYSSGRQANEGMRDDVVSIGQRTGADNWRTDVKNEAQEAGLQDMLGFTGQEMLIFQDTLLSNRGAKDQDDLNSAQTGLAEFSRTTGMDAETTTGLFDSLFGSTVMDGDSVGDIQNAFVGAIKQSGMEGREEQQIDALKGVIESIGARRTLDDVAVQNIMGLQSMFAQTGEESMRGERGAENMEGLDDVIKGSVESPMMSLIMGMGTKYQGQEGYLEAKKQADKGIGDIDNIKRIVDYTGSPEIAKTDEQHASNIVRLLTSEGMDVSGEFAEALVALDNEGKITQESLEELIENDLDAGVDASGEKIENYMGQDDAAANQASAIQEKQQSQFADLGRHFDKLSIMLGVLPPVGYVAITAMGTLTTALLTTASSFITGSAVRGLAGKRYGGRGSPGIPARRANTNNNNVGNATRSARNAGGGGLGGLLAGLGLGGNKASQAAPGTRSARHNGGFMGNLFGRKGGGSNGILPGNGKGLPSGGGLGAGMKGMMGNMMLPMMAIGGVSAVASAEKGEKMETAGSAGGGMGGMMLGAKGGAAAGSLAGPIGTAIGTVAGGLIGSIAGSEIGGWIGDKLGGLWNWTKGLFGGGDKDEEKDKKTDESNVGGMEVKQPPVQTEYPSHLEDDAVSDGSSTEGIANRDAPPLSRTDKLAEAHNESSDSESGYGDLKEMRDANKADKATKMAEAYKESSESEGGYGELREMRDENKSDKATKRAEAYEESLNSEGGYGDLKEMREDTQDDDLSRTDKMAEAYSESSDSESGYGDLKATRDANKADKAAKKDSKGSSSAGTAMDAQVDRENVTQAEGNENKRLDNVSLEEQNITRQENLMATAQKLLNQAKMQNGIFGHSDGMGGGDESISGGLLQGGENEDKIWDFFQKQGFSEEGTAGIMGNLQQESGLDPNAQNPNGAFGIAQWMDGRKENLESYAESKGKGSNDLQTQLEFLMKELQGGDGTSAQALEGLLGATSVKGATDLFESKFERSGGDAMGKRRDYAEQYHNNLSGGINVASTVNVSMTGADTNTTQNRSKLSNVGKDIVDKVFTSMNYHAKETRRA